MTEVDVPTEIGYGEVVGRFVKFTADTADPGSTPNEVPLTGSVLLIPMTQFMRWPTVDPPRLAVAVPLDCPVVNGDLCAPGTTSPGVHLVATDQPLAHPTLIQWRATFHLAGVSAQPASVVFNVPTGGVVDLALVVSVPPEPPAILVVDPNSGLEVAAAADAAQAAADAAAASAANAAQAATDAAQVATQDAVKVVPQTFTTVKQAQARTNIGSVGKGELALNVKDYGAKGDGTTDDTTAIQAAINAAAGREVVFPGGTYKTSAALILKSGVHLRGQGKAQIIGSADHDIINDADVPVVGGSVRDLYLEVAASSTAGNGIELLAASGVTVRGCEVVAAWDAILFLTGSTNCQVVGNVIRNARHQGINVVSSTRIKVQGNLIDTVGTVNLHHGVYISAGSDIDVSGNTIKGAAGYAIHAYSVSGTPARFVIANNNCYDNGNGPSGSCGGIYVGGEAQYSDVAITGNVIVDAGSGMGIGATNVKRLTITGNIVRLTGSHGISLESVGGLAIGFTVTGNDVSAYNQNNTGASGMRVAISGTIFGGVVIGNQFREPAGSGPAAIYSSGNANYLIVTGNDMRGAGSLALGGANNVSANNLTP